jgi:hypothetical protein
MEENGDGDDFGEWRSLLTKNRSSIWDGPYDIVVIMTGANDLKSAFFPFLVCKEESKFREDALIDDRVRTHLETRTTAHE